MSRIRILPDRVANQIAAGEVVERPAAVVKELLENSLDAGATRVEVEFRQGGKRLIRVEDNGEGMTPDDALLALERHATSKIRVAEDLNSVRSFGFRGEALPSIASVSRFTLQTRPPGREEGCEIKVSGGKLLDRRACGMPVGTRIEVADLFYPVPARRKFLKTDQTESAHILQLVRWMAVAHPECAFTLLENGRIILQSPPCNGLRDRVEEIWGRDLASHLDPFEFENESIHLHGLLGRPGFSRSSRHEMICLVNRRPVESRTLNYALIEAYHTSVPKGRYPVVFLNVDLDPARIDVNVHPTKREIRFREETRVRHWVITSVLEHLRQATRPTVSPAGREAERPDPDPRPRPITPAATHPTPPETTAPTPMPEPTHTRHIATMPKTARATPSAPETPASGRRQEPPCPTPAPTRDSAPAGPALRNWRFLGHMTSGWILFETGQGLLLIDPAAARARIRYETVRQHFQANRRARQTLLLPLSLDLEPVAAACLAENLEYLNANGFQVEPFGRHYFRVLALPPWLEPGDGEGFLRDLVDAVRQRGLKLDLEQPELAHQALARMAVDRGRGPRTRFDEAHASLQLAESLLQCRDPLTDPSGRATMVELARSELERRFGARGQSGNAG